MPSPTIALIAVQVLHQECIIDVDLEKASQGRSVGVVGVPLVMKRVGCVGIEAVNKEGVGEGAGSLGNNRGVTVGVDGGYRCSGKEAEGESLLTFVGRMTPRKDVAMVRGDHALLVVTSRATSEW